MMNTKLWASVAIAATLSLGMTACGTATSDSGSTAEQASATAQADSANPCAANPCAGAATLVSFNADDGVAILGTDPVAYFTQGEAVQGSEEFEHEWNGVVWRFANAEHRDLFAAAPEQYAPQYGGYCAWAVSQGATAPIEPDAWKIVDGKLYLNYNSDVQTRWEQDIPGNIDKANQNWPGVLTQ